MAPRPLPAPPVAAPDNGMDNGCPSDEESRDEESCAAGSEGSESGVELARLVRAAPASPTRATTHDIGGAKPALGRDASAAPSAAAEPMAEPARPVAQLPEVDEVAFSLSATQRQVGARSELLVAIEGVVYDLNSFAAEHPGGAGVLERLAGSAKATEAFKAVGHSKRALGMMAAYAVGRLRDPKAEPLDARMARLRAERDEEDQEWTKRPYAFGNHRTWRQLKGIPVRREPHSSSIHTAVCWPPRV